MSDSVDDEPSVGGVGKLVVTVEPNYAPLVEHVTGTSVDTIVTPFRDGTLTDVTTHTPRKVVPHVPLSPRRAVAEDALRSSSHHPDPMRPSPRSNERHAPKLELKTGDEVVTGSPATQLYSFPHTYWSDSVESRARGAHGRNPSNGTSGVLLHSFSHLGRNFHDSALSMATLEVKRKEAHEAMLRQKQHAAWEGQILNMIESHTGTDLLGVMKESIAKSTTTTTTTTTPAKVKNSNNTGNSNVSSSPTNKQQQQPRQQQQQPLSPRSMLVSDSKQSLDDSFDSSHRRRRSTDPNDEPLNVSSPSENRRRKKANGGGGGGSAVPEQPVIRLRRSKQQQRLALAALQSQRDGLLSTSSRPRNPFTDDIRSSKMEGSISTSQAPLTYDTKMSARNFRIIQANQDLKRKIRHGEVMRELGVSDENMGTSQPTTIGTGSEAHFVQLAGVDPLVYTPSPLFSTVTKSVLHIPFYTEPGLSGTITTSATGPGSGGGMKNGNGQTDPNDYLRKDKSTIEARTMMNEIQTRIEKNIETSYQHALQSSQQQYQQHHHQGGGNGSQILSNFLTSSRDVNPLLPGGLGSKVDQFKILVDQLRKTGMYESSNEQERTAAEIFGGGTQLGAAPMSQAKIDKAYRAGVFLGGGASFAHDTPEYQHMEFTKMVGNNHSKLNLQQQQQQQQQQQPPPPIALGSSELNPNQSLELSRLARSLPYAVKIHFRSSRIRVSRTTLLYFFGTMPGCTRVDEILLSPSMDMAYVSFQFNRFLHSGVGISADPSVTGGRTGVECDGIQAVRLHVRIVCAETPTPYLQTHAVRQSTMMTQAAPNSELARMSDEAHAEMRVLLRFLFVKSSIHEWSQVQMDGLKRQWKMTHTMPHVKDLETIRPTTTTTTTTIHGEGSKKNRTMTTTTNSSAVQIETSGANRGNTNDSSAVSLMSQDVDHMFSPLTRPGDESTSSSVRSGRRSGVSRPAGVCTSRRPRVGSDIPALSWPDGLFQHVTRQQQQHQQQQQMIHSSRTNHEDTTKKLIPRPPNTCRTMSQNQHDNGIASSRSHTSRSVKSAPGGGVGVVESDIECKDSSSSSSTNFVPSTRFFRTSGDLSNLTMIYNHPSGPATRSSEEDASQMERLLTEADEKRSEMERQSLHQQWKASQRAPVRNQHGEVHPITLRRLKKSQPEDSLSKGGVDSEEHASRLTQNLAWASVMTIMQA